MMVNEDETEHLLAPKPIHSTNHDRVRNLTGVERFGKRVYLLHVIFCIYVIAFIVNGPTASQYIYARIEEEYFPNTTLTTNQTGTSICYQNTSDPAFLTQEQAQKEAASWQLYISIVTGIPCVFATVILGTYSDKIGRRWLFIAPICGTICRTLIYAAISLWRLPLWVIFVAHFLEGCSGHFIVMILVTLAYTSDITTHGESRTIQIVLVESLLGLAFALSGFGTGYLIRLTGFTIPYAISLALLITNVILIYILPETRPKSAQTNAKGIFHFVYRTFRFYTSKDNQSPRLDYQILMAIYTTTTLVFVGKAGVETLFELNTPLCWDSVKIGRFSAISSVLQSIGTLVVIRLLQRFLTDIPIGIICATSAVAGITLQGFASTDAMMYSASVVRLIGTGTLSIVRSTSSKLTSNEEYGALFASMACVESVTTTVGQVIFSAIYGATLHVYRGIAFFTMGVFLLAAVIFYILLYILMEKPDTKAHLLRIADMNRAQMVETNGEDT